MNFFKNNPFYWQQNPLSAEELREIGQDHYRRLSIQTKIALILTVALLSFGIISAAISYRLYMDASIEQHIRLGEGAANLAASSIDPEKVDEYLAKGEQAEGYLNTKLRLYYIRDSSVDIEYVYVYKIMEDGCHVVFDLDTDENKGTPTGSVEDFDETFLPYLPALLSGHEIEPIISDDQYGWLLTIYKPVYDRDGVCRCYAAVDISMNELREQAREYLRNLGIIFLGITLLILLIAFRLAKYHFILPINTMAHAAKIFTSNQNDLGRSLSKVANLDVRTGDEIENLYQSFLRMTADIATYMRDIKHKTDTISKMHNAFILTIADLVEQRDENTGQHIRKTAAYVKIIMEEMKREGIYADKLTDEFMRNVINSAPLHDVGKINVPDAILNKPGKLTDEEFDKMKFHTTAGKNIIDSIIAAVPDSEYLYEARNLATYHHEKWNGKGYPMGLSGEDIPLSARIMAVADVFDALVSNRSYKKGFPYEKALAIIKEDSGSHFDPQIVAAFFAAKDEVLKVADKFSKMETS